MMLRLLLIDNFDSFVYNLAQAFGSLDTEPIVVRSDVTMATLKALDPDGVIISPGPGDPTEAGISVEAIETFSHEVPVLGVCLGHQCIGAAFGGDIGRAAVGPVHGKTSNITHTSAGVFRDLPSPFVATRYHSLAVEEDPWPQDLEITARSDDGVVMGVRHKHLPVEGVQFHPESVLTERGPQLLLNFVEDVRAASSKG